MVPEVRLGGTGYFRVVAFDYDGTLAEGEIQPAVLAALDRARARGLRLLLVTGRILAELRAVFPTVDEYFDAIVAENGAVIAGASWKRLLASPVDDRLGPAIAARGVSYLQGDVLLACSAADELTVLEEVRRLGLDSRLVRNRGELMVVPGGVTKGTGLFEALGDFGLSRHNAIAVGDAENDHSLMEVAEVGLAVANAVEGLRTRADAVLERPNGDGVVDLLDGLLDGTFQPYPRRWRVGLGEDDAGESVFLPASQVNVLVAGGAGGGKSYLAGRLAEELIRMGYSLLVVDPEGDHRGLGRLRGVTVMGGEFRLPPTDELMSLIRHRYGSLVLDLSGMDRDAQPAYVRAVAAEVVAQRVTNGLPQWVFIDEAHGSLGRHGAALDLFDPSVKGYCSITWRPEDLAAEAVAGIDAVLALSSPQPSSALVDITAAVADLPRTAIAHLLLGAPGRAVLAERRRPGHATAFTLSPRVTPHLRHEHKYHLAGVGPAQRFYFRGEGDTLTGVAAGNLGELQCELGRCGRDVLRHHCPGQDFSRWVLEVFHDAALAARLRVGEAAMEADSPAAEVEAARVRLVAALQTRLQA